MAGREATAVKIDKLQEEIDTRSQQIRTDFYPMSVGELINLYRDGELDVHPEFQRIYRWSDSQKTRLIESLLLGIPLPAIFVAQRPDGVWDVVDGVQRLSTILQFVGILKDDEGRVVPPLVLQRTEYLPSLEGKVWEDKQEKTRSFTRDQQLYIKRCRLDISIILKESDADAKYELFMRLNTGGTRLTQQGVRNCLLIMAHRETYHWLVTLVEDKHFLDVIALSDRAIEEQYHLELALRFLTLRTLPEPELSKIGDIGDFLNEKVRDVAAMSAKQRSIEKFAFVDTFRLLAETIGDNAFRRYDPRKHRFMGGFLISLFEAVALGIGFHSNGKAPLSETGIEAKAKDLWTNSKFTGDSGAGVRASSRIPKIVPLGRKIFSP